MFDNWKRPGGPSSVARSLAELITTTFGFDAIRSRYLFIKPEIHRDAPTTARSQRALRRPRTRPRYNCNLQKLNARPAGRRVGRHTSGQPQSPRAGGIADVIWRERNEKSGVFGHLPCAIDCANRASKRRRVRYISRFRGQTFSSRSPRRLMPSSAWCSAPVGSWSYCWSFFSASHSYQMQRYRQTIDELSHYACTMDHPQTSQSFSDLLYRSVLRYMTCKFG